MNRNTARTIVKYLLYGYTVSLLLALALCFYKAAEWNGHFDGGIYSIYECIFGVAWQSFNVWCIYYLHSMWYRIIMGGNVVLLSAIQSNWAVVIVLLCTFVVFAFFQKRDKVVPLIVALVLELQFLLFSYLVIPSGPYLATLNSVQNSPSEGYQIVISKNITVTGRCTVDLECRKNNDLFVLGFRVVKRQDKAEISLIDASDANTVFWVSDIEFTVGGKIYSVEDFPININERT